MSGANNKRVKMTQFHGVQPITKQTGLDGYTKKITDTLAAWITKHRQRCADLAKSDEWIKIHKVAVPGNGILQVAFTTHADVLEGKEPDYNFIAFGQFKSLASLQSDPYVATITADAADPKKLVVELLVLPKTRGLDGKYTNATGYAGSTIASRFVPIIYG